MVKQGPELDYLALLSRETDGSLALGHQMFVGLKDGITIEDAFDLDHIYTGRELNNLRRASRLTQIASHRTQFLTDGSPFLKERRSMMKKDAVASETRPSMIEDFSALLERYTREFPREMKLMENLAMHPSITPEQPMINPYTRQPEYDQFRNVGYHLLAVAFFAETIARKIFPHDLQKVKEITRRALTHDLNKPYETMRARYVKEKRVAAVANNLQLDESSIRLGSAYTIMAYENIAYDLGLSGVDFDNADTEYLKKAGKETGHNSLGDFLTVSEGEIALREADQETLMNMIVHLADDLTSSPGYDPSDAEDKVYPSEYLIASERMEQSNFPEKYPFLYKEGLAFDLDGNMTRTLDATSLQSPDELVRTYAQLQPFVSGEIAKYLLEMMIGSRMEVAARLVLLKLAATDPKYAQFAPMLLDSAAKQAQILDISSDPELAQTKLIELVQLEYGQLLKSASVFKVVLPI